MTLAEVHIRQVLDVNTQESSLQMYSLITIKIQGQSPLPVFSSRSQVYLGICSALTRKPHSNIPNWCIFAIIRLDMRTKFGVGYRNYFCGKITVGGRESSALLENANKSINIKGLIKLKNTTLQPSL